jgi:hypothetical protein
VYATCQPKEGCLQTLLCCRPQVLHVPDIDFNSTVWTFVEGLQAIKVHWQDMGSLCLRHRI